MSTGAALNAALEQLRSVKQERTKARRTAAWRCFRNDPELSVSRVAERIGASTGEVSRWRREYAAGEQP